MNLNLYLYLQTSNAISESEYVKIGPGSLLDGRAEISVIFGWDFGRNDDATFLTQARRFLQFRKLLRNVPASLPKLPK